MNEKDAQKLEIERLKALMVSYKSLNSIYDKLAREMQKALNGNDLETKNFKIEEISKQIKENINNIETIKKEMLNISQSINKKACDIIDARLNYIIKEYRMASRGVKIAFGIDGCAILEKDKIEYDSLYALKKIINNVKNEELVIVDDIICANPIQKEPIKDLLKKVNIFKNSDKEIVLDKGELNNNLLDSITKELRRLEERRKKQKHTSSLALNNIRVLNEDLEEYNNLIKIAQILNRAPKENGTLVWDVAYVLPRDVETLKNLMDKTKLFKEYNLDLKMKDKYQQVNQEMIEKLENYLDELAKNISKYTGYSNLPIKESKKIGDKVWIVAVGDLEEANNIIDIIKILNDVDSEMINILNVGYVKKDNYIDIQDLILKTKYFKTEDKDFTINEDRIKLLEEYIKVVKEMLNNKAVKEEEAQELIKLYQEEMELLKNINSENSILINNVYLNKDEVEKYIELQTKEKDVKNKVYQTLNREKINLIQEFIANKENNKEYSEELNNILKDLILKYQELLKYLNKAKTGENVVLINEYYIDENDSLEFKKLIDSLNNLEDNYKKAKIEDEKINEDKIRELNLLIQSMVVKEIDEDTFQEEDLYFKNKDKIKITMLKEMLGYLIKAKSASKKEKYKDVYLDINDKDSYILCEKVLEKLNTTNEVTDDKDQQNKDSLSEKTKKRMKGKIRKPKVKENERFINDNYRFIIGAGLAIGAVSYFIGSMPTLAPALIYANCCNAIAFPKLAGLFNGLNKVITTITDIRLVNGAYLTGSGAIINDKVAASHALGSTLKALAPLGILGASFLVNLKLLAPKEEKPVEKKKQSHIKKYIQSLLARMRAGAYEIKTDINENDEQITVYDGESDYIRQVENLMPEEQGVKRTRNE